MTRRRVDRDRREARAGSERLTGVRIGIVGNVLRGYVVARDQALPPSVDLMTDTLRPRGVNFGLPVVEICSKKSYRVPFLGSTTTTFPIVWLFGPGSKIGRAVVHVWPKSLVFENQAGPRKACALKIASTVKLGDSSRSQTTYAIPAWFGSAVTDSLSLKKCVASKIGVVP